MGFEWQTDEEDWEKEPDFGGGKTAVLNRYRPFLPLALILLPLLLLAGWLLSRSATNQIQETTSDLSGDILAVHALLNQAALTNDADLFASFLPPAGYGRSLPLALFREDYFLDRPFLNLSAADLPPDQPPRVSLSPDLSRAELTSLQPYTPANQPAARPIWLERLTLYRQVDGRWQLSRWPIDETFWGDTQEVRAGLLTAEFPARDQEPGQRLAVDIGRLIDDICANPDINCPPNFWLKMLLMPYGQNLLDMNANYRTLPLSSGYDAYRIFLPTPTLVGRPIDEAGYQALYQGYAAWIAAVLVQHYSQIRPVSHEVTADFLSQWQLTPPPPPVLPGPLLESAEPPPIPFPDQDILLVCQGYSPTTWLTYSPTSDSWQTIPTPANAPALAQLLEQAGQYGRLPPEGQGTLIRRPFTIAAAQRWQSYLWLGGLTSLLTADSPDLFLADPRHQQPDNDQLLFYPFDGQGSPYLAQTAACLAGNCRLEKLAGTPVWSPSAEQTLLTIIDENNRPQIYLGNKQGQPQHYLTGGHNPRWLDETHFLYIGPDSLKLWDGRLDQAGQLLENSQLLDVATIQTRSQQLALSYFEVYPARPELLFTAVVDTTTQEDQLLLLDRLSGNLLSWFALPQYRLAMPFHFTEDGRFLTITAFERDSLSGSWQLFVFDLQRNLYSGRHSQYSTSSAYFDWAAGGDWLLIAEDNALHLIAPAHNYQRQIPHTLGCHTLGWFK